MRVEWTQTRGYNTPGMRWIWGGILLTTLTLNLSLVWAGGNGVERAPIFWGTFDRNLPSESRELIEEEIQKACPAAFAEADSEKPVIVSSMTDDYTDAATRRKDQVPTKRFAIGLKRQARDGERNVDLGVIVELRKSLSEKHKVEVIHGTKANEVDCQTDKK